MYLEHFGLEAAPFQLTPDARFFFDSRTHKKAMAYLGFGLSQGEGFIVITGEIGAGKTTLVEHLVATIDTTRLKVVRIATTQVEGEDLLRLVARSLGARAEGVSKAELLAVVERALEAETESGKRVLVIVDEAQNLPPSALEELRLLSNLVSGKRPLVQIFLLGQPEFRARLNTAPELEQLRQRVIAVHHLEPLNADEVAAYLLHRLGRAGWSGRPRFDDEAAAALHRLSGGIPRRINMLAHRALLQAAVDGQDDIGSGEIEDVSGEVAWPTVAEPVRAVRGIEPQAERIAMLEDRLEAQDAALRRILTLLVDWVEGDRHAGARTRAVRTDAA